VTDTSGMGNTHTLEFQKLELERQKVSIELDKARTEKAKIKWTAFASIIPFLAIIATIAFGIWTMQQQSRLSLQLEIAKAIMQSSRPEEAVARGQFYKNLFPNEVPDQFFGHSDSALDWSPKDVSSAAKVDFIRLVAARGLDPAQTVTMWHLLFPDDYWATEKDLLQFVGHLPAGVRPDAK
jgi:hypothetical protein